MIEIIEGMADDVVGVSASGTISASDYEDVLVPALEGALERHDKIRFLYHIGPGFERFSSGAMLDDAKLGLHRLTSFARLAFVSDIDWLRQSVELFSFAIPCPVQVFANAELDAAKRWLVDPLGAIDFESDGETGVVKVRLKGALEASAYAGFTSKLDAFIEKRGSFTLMLDLREFHGWEGLDAVWKHFVLVRDHHAALERIAVVGSRAWQRRAVAVLSSIVRVEANYYDAADYAEAEKWVAGSA